MKKAQLQAGLAFNSETLSEAENTLRRIKAESYPQLPYYEERLNTARSILEDAEISQGLL